MNESLNNAQSKICNPAQLESATALTANSSTLGDTAFETATAFDSHVPFGNRVIERALQGYVPETPQQVSELVSGLMSILPLEEPVQPSELQPR
jgi:hypothetical protein